MIDMCELSNRLCDARSQFWILKLAAMGLRDGQLILESERQPYADALVPFAEIQNQFDSLEHRATSAPE